MISSVLPLPLAATMPALLALALCAAAQAADGAPGKPGRETLDCPSLLLVASDGKDNNFTMTTCDVSLTLDGDPADPDLVFKLKPGVAAWWRETFAAGQERPLDGQGYSVRPFGSSNLPPGRLVEASRAGAVRGPKWLWDREEGTLRSRDMRMHLPGAAGMPTAEACQTFATGHTVVSLPSAMTPGTVFAVGLYQPVAPHSLKQVPAACTTAWSAGDAQVALHPRWGIGMVSAQVQDGQRFTVRGKLGERSLQSEVLVYSASARPLVGFWRQVAERPCDAALRKPAVPISEFYLRPDGRFDLTWVPKNHSYVDYSGTYRYQTGTREFSWDITGGQASPGDAERSGTAQVNERGQLVLTGLHPGTRQAGDPKLCELVFEK